MIINTGHLKSTDADKDPITYFMVNNTSNGNITVNHDGSFIYNPADGFTGNDTFTYRAMDWKGNGNICTVMINIHPPNHLPEAENMTFRLAENENITGELLATDADGDNILYQIVNKSLNGTITLNIDGTFTYTPRIGMIGNDTFTYLANDWQGQSNLGSISLEIYEFNHPPVAQNISIATFKNKPYIGSFKATDIDNNKLTFKIVNNTHHGTIKILKSDKFIYTPKTSFIGNDNFTYYAYDGKNQSNTVIVSINVTNKKPIIIHENILIKTNNRKSQINYANAIKTITAPQTTQLQDIQEPYKQINHTNITPPQNNTQNSPISINNPIKYLLTLINNVNDHINHL
jgi:VCBS repeat-containing protein